MAPGRSLISRAVIVGVSAIAISYADLSPRSGEVATYNHMAPQIAPPTASELSLTQIAAILDETAPNSPYLVAFQLTTTDTNGTVASAAPLKVVPTNDPIHPYLGVFHNQINSTQFATYLGYSNDLRVWHTLGEIHSPASQPDLRILPDDSVLYAEEYNPSHRPYVRVHYYSNTGLTGLQALIANPAVTPTNAITLPETPLARADGTPEFGRITYGGSITRSEIEIKHHYFYQGQRDLDAVGTLTNFDRWSSPPDATTNDLVTNAGGIGKIGDREVFQVGSHVYEVVEAQVGPSGNDYGAWRLFLIDKTTATIQKLSPVLYGGAQSLGNPTVSFVTLPITDIPALVFTCFIFSANNGTTPPGGHMFVYPLK